MDTVISSTEAARHFGDVLSRVRHAGESFVVTKSQKPLARLVPVRMATRACGAEIMEALARMPHDPGFGEDLDRVNQLDAVPAIRGINDRHIGSCGFGKVPGHAAAIES